MSFFHKYFWNTLFPRRRLSTIPSAHLLSGLHFLFSFLFFKIKYNLFWFLFFLFWLHLVFLQLKKVWSLSLLTDKFEGKRMEEKILIAVKPSKWGVKENTVIIYPFVYNGISFWYTVLVPFSLILFHCRSSFWCKPWA